MSPAPLTSAQRIGAALSHQEADRVPYLLPTILQGARELGLSIEQYFSSAENIAEGQLRLRSRYRHDGLFGFMYAAQEVEAFGGSVIFTDDGPPNAGRPPLSAGDIASLEPPDPAACPGLVRVLEAIRMMAKRVDGEAPILGVAIAPFSLSVMQLGFEAYIDLLYEEPEIHGRLMAVNEAFCVAWSNAQLAAGASAISYIDPVSSPAMVPREVYLE